VITEITEKTRELGPYRPYEVKPDGTRPAPAASPVGEFHGEDQLRETSRKLLAEGTVRVVIGHGAHGPVFVTAPEQVGRLVWNQDSLSNLTVYLKRKEVRALGKAAIVV
jgi:hypothetical protein